MKFCFNPLLFFLIIFLFENSAYSLSDYQIKKICKNMNRRSACIKNYKLKKSNLIKGNKIEIPVIPYKK